MPRNSVSRGRPKGLAAGICGSTLTRSRIAISRADGRQGAMPTPQLPITTVVTPCQEDGVIAGSEQICAS